MSFLGKDIILKVDKNKKLIFHGKIRIDAHAEIISKGHLVFGDKCVINPYSRIIAFNKIVLGNRVIIARFVSILDHDHKFSLDESGELNIEGYNTAPIIIGNNVWIGDKVSIMKGVVIGDNVIIGANSVVARDIPSNTVAAGIPCRVIKPLKDNIRT